jgi:hypothetical protein
MKFVILNTAEAKAHGITIIPTMRQSADNSQVVLHDEYIRSIDGFESLPKYDMDSFRKESNRKVLKSFIG